VCVHVHVCVFVCVHVHVCVYVLRDQSKGEEMRKGTLGRDWGGVKGIR